MPSIMKHKTVKQSLSVAYSSIGGKNLEFSDVEVCIFLMAVGDNPCIKKGVPMQLSWKPEAHYSGVSFEEMDANKKSANKEIKKYPVPVYHIPPAQRSKILREHGYGLKELQEAQKHATIARNRRSKTVQNLESMEFDEKVQNWIGMMTCKKEEVLEYPRPTLAAEEAPEVSASLRKLPYACGRCCLIASESSAPASKLPFSCDGKNCTLHMSAVLEFASHAESSNATNLLTKDSTA